ncbi:MAG: hypothetical protein GYB67_16960 [Chloroflexi bacterium]|nr:hypothetical protein [Chloroflexota bacterium]
MSHLPHPPQSTQAKPTRLRRLINLLVFLLVFRLVPLLLILGVIWFGAQVTQNIIQRANEQIQADERRPLYAATATAIAAVDATPTPEPVSQNPAELRPLFKRPAQIAQDAGIVQTLDLPELMTNTPRPTRAIVDLTIPPLNTRAPTATPSGVPSPTLPPSPMATVTPRPLPTLLIYPGPDANDTAPIPIPEAIEPLDRRGNDLINIMLLGNDGELTNDGFLRTDTMIIVSVNRTTGTVSMLSFPRDLYVYIPGWTMQRLNLAFIHGQSIGWTDGGFGLLRQTIFYNFGINIHYYAMVNLEGFRNIVDAVGGVELAVDCAIQDLALIGAEVPSGAYQVNDDPEYVLPVGYYEMTGAEALWYARSRGNSSDFDRGRRQQQVLRAVWRQVRENGLLAQVPQLWAEGSQFIETNLAFEDILGLVPYALNLDPSRIENFTFTYTYHTTPWQTPDGEAVQLPNRETLRFMLEDFYAPPTDSQIVIEAARIAVYNGTDNPNWDRVAAERLAWDGFNAVALGSAASTDYADTVVVDQTGSTKGSSLQDIAWLLNVGIDNVRIEPDANREFDFVVTIGETYNSCVEEGILPVDEISVGQTSAAGG